MRNGWLALTGFLVACGGASDSGLFSGGDQNGQSTPNGTSTQPPAPAPNPPPGGNPPEPPPTGCTTPTTYYEDTDGDGFGGTKTKAACSPPGSDWVTKNGDCDDDDANVFPGQTKYFSIAYQTNGGGNHSFDYDCSKKEEEQPPGYKTASTCTAGAVPGTCTGDGYLPVDGRPSGTGIDRICGSTKYQTCTYKAAQQTCLSVLSDVPPAECH